MRQIIGRLDGRGAAILGALLLVTLMITRTSQAAFTATTDNAGNSFEAGEVDLADDDGGSTAMFTVTEMLPGDVDESCIKVDYTGVSGPNAVKLYSSGLTSTDSAGGADGADGSVYATNVALVVQIGSAPVSAPPGFQNCTGFTPTGTIYTGTLSDFASTHTDWTSGVTGWTPTTGAESRIFRFETTLSTATPNSEQGDSSTIGFVWEVTAGA